jgi:hypothetical protein
VEAEGDTYMAAGAQSVREHLVVRWQVRDDDGDYAGACRGGEDAWRVVETINVAVAVNVSAQATIVAGPSAGRNSRPGSCWIG